MRGTILNLFCVLTVSSFLFALPDASSASRYTRTPLRRVQKQAKPSTVIRRPDPAGIAVVATGTFSDAEKMWQPSAALLKNGNIFVAWQDLAPMAGQEEKGAAGYGMIFNPQMRQIGVKVIYTDTRPKYFVSHNKTLAFADGNVLVTYHDGRDARKGKYVVFNPQLRIIKGPVVYNQTETEFTDITTLPGGNAALIAYHRRTGAKGSGRMIIVNSAGDIIVREKVFSPKGLTSNITADLLPDGLIYILYNCGFTHTKIFDPYGNIVRGEKRMPGRNIERTQICTLTDGNVLAFHGAGQCLIFNRAGEIVGGPHPFAEEGVDRILTTKLPNGNIFVTTIDRNEKVICRVVNPQGQVVRGPKTLDRTTNRSGGALAQTAFPGNRILLIFGGQDPGYVILK